MQLEERAAGSGFGLLSGDGYDWSITSGGEMVYAGRGGILAALSFIDGWNLGSVAQLGKRKEKGAC